MTSCTYFIIMSTWVWWIRVSGHSFCVLWIPMFCSHVHWKCWRRKNHGFWSFLTWSYGLLSQNTSERWWWCENQNKFWLSIQHCPSKCYQVPCAPPVLLKVVQGEEALKRKAESSHMETPATFSVTSESRRCLKTMQCEKAGIQSDLKWEQL